MANQLNWAAKLLFENLQKKVPSVSSLTSDDPVVLYDENSFPKFIVSQEKMGSIWQRSQQQVDEIFGSSSAHEELFLFQGQPFNRIVDEVFRRVQTPIKETLTIALYLGKSALNEIGKAVGFEDGVFHCDDAILTIEDTETGMAHHFLSNPKTKTLSYQISTNEDYENVYLISDKGISEHLGRGDYLDRQQVNDLFSKMSTFEQKEHSIV